MVFHSGVWIYYRTWNILCSMGFDATSSGVYELIVAFTGHRPSKVGGYKLPNPTYIRVCQSIEQVLRDLKPEKAISGMALGIDQWAASVCIKNKVPFLAAVPFVGQENIWPEDSKRIYNILLAKAAEVVVVSEGDYSAVKLQLRNEWMVDHCDKVIAVWDGTQGGTANCVKYAQSLKKDIIIINPQA